MTIAGSVADVLRDHVVLEYEAIDRMYLNVYVPHLQTVGPWSGTCGFIDTMGVRQRGVAHASSAETSDKILWARRRGCGTISVVVESN
jgi:hypothetical protein